MTKKSQQYDLSIEKVRDHLANERTFLAWIRTAIAVMVFGFVVEKFSLFLKQISVILGKNNFNLGNVSSFPSKGYSSAFGIALVGVGALLCILAYIKYKKIEFQINTENYKPTLLIDLLFAILIFTIGLLLTLYMFAQI